MSIYKKKAIKYNFKLSNNKQRKENTKIIIISGCHNVFPSRYAKVSYKQVIPDDAKVSPKKTF